MLGESSANLGLSAGILRTVTVSHQTLAPSACR